MKSDDPVPEPDVARAVQAVLAGEPDAFAVIVRRFQDTIMTVATGLLRDPRAAAELTQDVFVRAYERLRSFDLSRPMKPWLVKIAYRLAQDRWRERAAGREQPLGAHEQGRARSEQGPLEALIADEGGRALWRAVATLPPAERIAAMLYYREGLSVDEVAEATDVSAGTVKTLLFRARGRLRALLANKVTGQFGAGAGDG